MGRLAAVLLIGALASVAGVVAFGPDGGRSPATRGGAVDDGNDDGPLSSGRPTRTTAPIPVGDALTFGGIILYNDGHEPIELVSVEIDEIGAGLDVFAIRTHPAERQLVGTGSWPPYPEEEMARPHGQIVERQQPLQLVLGVRRTAAGSHRISGISVTYEVGDRTYTERLVHEFAATATAPP